MMMKRCLAFYAVITAVLVFAAGCSNEAKAAQTETTILYGIPTEPDHLDPYEATSADSRFILFNVFEGLFKPAPDGRLIPAVASSYTVSDDFLTWTIALKPDVFFHNGKRVTAADVQYSLRRAAEKKLYGMQSIQSVDIADNDAVVIRLSEGDAEFYYYLTNAIVPADYTAQNESPVGTGPFEFVSFTPQYELVLQKHDNYWNAALPKSDGLTFKIKADYNSIMLDLKAGSLNAGTLNNTSVLQLNQSDYNIFYDNLNAPQVLALNNAYKPLSDPRVRKAISHVVDAEEIMDLAHNGKAVRVSTPVIPALSYAYNGSNDTLYATDIEKARTLLNEAGYRNGFSLVITVPSVYQPHIDAAQVIVNQLAHIGIRASIQQVDWATWLDDVYFGRKYEATVIGVDGVTLSPRSYLFRYESSHPENFINYKSAAYDELYNAALKMPDEAERTQAYKRMQQILSDDAASVFICDLVVPRVFAKNIFGFQGYPLYVFDASALTMQK